MNAVDTKRCVKMTQDLLFTRSGKIDVALDQAGTFFFTATLIRETNGRRTLNLEMGKGWTVKKANFDLTETEVSTIINWIRRTGNRLV